MTRTTVKGNRCVERLTNTLPEKSKKKRVSSSKPKEEWTDFEAYNNSGEDYFSDSDDLRKLAALDFINTSHDPQSCGS